MINPLKTGAYIARLRKKRDWTQVELADKLHVTHQAVSRWEVGESFPDLGTLAQLAQLFGVRMDSLVDGGQTLFSGETSRNKVFSELAEGHAEQVARLVADNPADMETVIESGPLTRPSLMNQVVENLDKYAFTLEQVVGLAPFLGQDSLDALVAGLDGPVDGQALVGLAPFLGRDQLNRLAAHLEGGKLEKNHLVGLAPFLDRQALELLIQHIPAGEIESYQIAALAPFVSRSLLDRLVESLPEQSLDLEQLISLAPFVDHKTLARLITLVPEGTLDAHAIVALAPFLDTETLEGLIRGQK
jgi:transcriptional regulator with XRE-family HTH domain